MGENAGEFGTCIECADAAEETLAAEGKSGVRVRLEAKAIGVRTEGGEMVNATDNGVHEWVESEGTHYDNFNPSGTPTSTKPVEASGIQSITEKPF